MKTNMPPEEFRRHGHEVIDWIADYMEHIRDYPVLASVQPGELAARLPESAPEQGETMDAVLADFRELIVPAITHWNHPRFHGYFSVSGSGPGILGLRFQRALIPVLLHVVNTWLRVFRCVSTATPL